MLSYSLRPNIVVLEQGRIARANRFVHVNDYFASDFLMAWPSSKLKVQHRSHWEPWKWGWLSSRTDILWLFVSYCEKWTFQPALNLLNGWERCVTSAVSFRRAFPWTLTHQMLLPLLKKSGSDQFAGQLLQFKRSINNFVCQLSQLSPPS